MNVFTFVTHGYSTDQTRRSGAVRLELSLEQCAVRIRSSKRALKHAELRGRIFDAALALFRRKGVAQATIREIAREADVGVGTFFNYFEGKEGVLEELGRQRQERLEALVTDSQLTGEPTQARIEHILRMMIDDMEREPALTRALVHAAMSSPALFHGERARFLALTQLLASVLREGQARGEVAADCDADVAAQLLISIYVTLTLDWAEGASDYVLLPTLLQHVETLWRGIAPRTAG